MWPEKSRYYFGVKVLTLIQSEKAILGNEEANNDSHPALCSRGQSNNDCARFWLWLTRDLTRYGFRLYFFLLSAVFCDLESTGLVDISLNVLKIFHLRTKMAVWVT